MPNKSIGNNDENFRTLDTDLISVKIKEYYHTIDENDKKITSFSLGCTNSKEKLEQEKLLIMSKKKRKFLRKVYNTFVVFLTIMLVQYFVFGTIDLLALNRDEKTVKVEIPKNAKNSQIAQILHEGGVVKNKDFFNFYATLTKSNKKFIPGTFEIKTNLDYEAVINFLRSNANRVESDIINVVIPEGKNVLEIAAILEREGVCTQEEFFKACNNSEIYKRFDCINSLKNQDKIVYKVEGYLFPDTYKFYKNSTPQFVIRKFLTNYNSKIGSKDYTTFGKDRLSVREYAQKIGLNECDLINIAAMIQAEAADERDMYNVSSVIHNRLAVLKTGNKNIFGEFGLNFLNVDATSFYPYKSKDKIPQNLRENFVSLYDTYKNPGLPVGAICSPGMLAIDAALRPNKTQYYYYCHDKSKKPYYAKTFSEHQMNLRKAGLL